MRPSPLTIEITDKPGGDAHLPLTEQGAPYGSEDGIKLRQEGTRELLDKLAVELEQHRD